MSKYQVKFYQGEYIDRQRAANADKAIVYIEQHFNSSSSPNSNYSTNVVATNASKKSKDFAAEYVKFVSTAFNVPQFTGGPKSYPNLLVGGYNGRGEGNVRYTDMPAVLLESLFISNPESVKVLDNGGIATLAAILSSLIKKHFPNGGLVAFSIGHKGKRINTTDLGAAAAPGGKYKWEAEYAEQVLKAAKELLELD